MLIFGITGATGAGKSTVSDLFRERGVYVADADKAARRVTEKGSPCLCELCAEFGAEILDKDGALCRKRLAAIAFSDKARLSRLNEITHKYIKEELLHEIKAAGAELAAIDGAVIIGSPVMELCSFLVVVTADERTRIRRIMARDGLTESGARQRIDAQPPQAEYLRHARYIIENNDNSIGLGEQVEFIYGKIKDG